MWGSGLKGAHRESSRTLQVGLLRNLEYPWQITVLHVAADQTVISQRRNRVERKLDACDG